MIQKTNYGSQPESSSSSDNTGEGQPEVYEILSDASSSPSSNEQARKSLGYYAALLTGQAHSELEEARQVEKVLIREARLNPLSSDYWRRVQNNQAIIATLAFKLSGASKSRFNILGWDYRTLEQGKLLEEAAKSRQRYDQADQIRRLLNLEGGVGDGAGQYFQALRLVVAYWNLHHSVGYQGFASVLIESWLVTSFKRYPYFADMDEGFTAPTPENSHSTGWGRLENWDSEINKQLQPLAQNPDPDKPRPITIRPRPELGINTTDLLAAFQQGQAETSNINQAKAYLDNFGQKDWLQTRLAYYSEIFEALLKALEEQEFLTLILTKFDRGNLSPTDFCERVQANNRDLAWLYFRLGYAVQGQEYARRYELSSQLLHALYTAKNEAISSKDGPTTTATTTTDSSENYRYIEEGHREEEEDEWVKEPACTLLKKYKEETEPFYVDTRSRSLSRSRSRSRRRKDRQYNPLLSRLVRALRECLLAVLILIILCCICAALGWV